MAGQGGDLQFDLTDAMVDAAADALDAECGSYLAETEYGDGAAKVLARMALEAGLRACNPTGLSQPA